MSFDPENPIVKLCAHGMSLEGEGKMNEALGLDGYGNLVKNAIASGLKRMQE